MRLLNYAIGLTLAAALFLLLDWPYYLYLTIVLGIVMVESQDLPSVARWFFSLVSLHALFGFWPSQLQGEVPLPAPNNAFGLLPKVFSIYATGVIATFLAYKALPTRFPEGISRLATQLSKEHPKLEKRALAAIAIGAGIIVLYVYKAGFIGMFISGVFDRMPSELTFYNSLARRGLALIAAAAPVAFFTRWRPLAMTAIALMLLTTRRGQFVLACVVICFVMFVQGRHVRLIKVGALALIALLLVLQYAFISYAIEETASTQRKVLFVAQSISAEIRETAWVLSEWNNHFFLGRTYFAALAPVPGAISDFKDRYSSAPLTLDIVGIDRSTGHGGIRMTSWGEAYLNFGYVGVLAIGILFSRALLFADDLLKRSRQLAPTALAATGFIIVFGVFQCYVSGTTTLSDGVLSLATLWFIFH